MTRWIVVTCLSVLMVACSSPSDDNAEKTAKPKEHVWQDQVDALEKARGVEKTLMDAEKRRAADMP